MALIRWTAFVAVLCFQWPHCIRAKDAQSWTQEQVEGFIQENARLKAENRLLKQDCPRTPLHGIPVFGDEKVEQPVFEEEDANFAANNTAMTHIAGRFIAVSPQHTYFSCCTPYCTSTSLPPWVTEVHVVLVLRALCTSATCASTSSS